MLPARSLCLVGALVKPMPAGHAVVAARVVSLRSVCVTTYGAACTAAVCECRWVAALFALRVVLIV